MNFLKKILNKADAPVLSNEDFWIWFLKNERNFFNIVKAESDIEKNFFNKLTPKLDELKEGFFYLTGMQDDDTAELIFTTDGIIKNFIFVEQLVNSAPEIKGWKFTALKPASEQEQFCIEMSGYQFNTENVHFYANEDPNLPDEIDLTIVYDHLDAENRPALLNGVFIFLDNYLGELNFTALIDNITIIGKDEAEKECVPVYKLKPFLMWREKEFVEKYENVKIDTEDHKHSIFKGESEIGNPLIAVINTELLAWSNKSSYPWMLKFQLFYDGSNNNGLPDHNTSELLYIIEDYILSKLKSVNGHLNVGKETFDGQRIIYFACNEFRKSSIIAYEIQEKYKKEMNITYEIYKDKYWQSLAYFEE